MTGAVTGIPERRKTLNVLKEAALTRGSYDAAGLDFSRNDGIVTIPNEPMVRFPNVMNAARLMLAILWPMTLLAEPAPTPPAS